MTRKDEPVYNKKTPSVGNKYRIKDGKYIGHWCRCTVFHKEHNFATVDVLDVWGKAVMCRDAIPLKYLEL